MADPGRFAVAGRAGLLWALAHGVRAVPALAARLGRSRGGWTTKLHLACEPGRTALSLVLTAGQRAGCPQFTTVLGRIRVARVGGGRPRSSPNAVLADKAYSSNANRAYLRQRSIRCVFPVKADTLVRRIERHLRHTT